MEKKSVDVSFSPAGQIQSFVSSLLILIVSSQLILIVSVFMPMVPVVCAQESASAQESTGLREPAVLRGLTSNNLLLVVNPNSSDSLTVANHYAFWRGIPQAHIFHLSWDTAKTSVPFSEFYDKLYLPVSRQVQRQSCLAVAFSSGYPTEIHLSDCFKTDELDKNRGANENGLERLLTLSGSLNGMMYLGRMLDQAGPRPWSRSLLVRNYYIYPIGVPFFTSTAEERLWRVEPFSQKFIQRHIPSVLLAVNCNHYSTGDALTNLRRSVQADGSKPAGTVYLMNNSDIRSQTRQSEFQRLSDSMAIVRPADGQAYRAEIIEGTLPNNKTDVIGLVAGSANFNWNGCGSKIIPGAVCEHLTSYGGVMFSATGQTPLTQFLRAGAAGASGTVTEPYAIAEKFPSCSLHLKYLSGLTLAEAFYSSVQWPYQLLIVGDPLCCPWGDEKYVDPQWKPEVYKKLAVNGQEVVIAIEGLSPTSEVRFGQMITISMTGFPQEAGAVRLMQGSRSVLEQTIPAQSSDHLVRSELTTRALGEGPVVLKYECLDRIGESVFSAWLRFRVLPIE